MAEGFIANVIGADAWAQISSHLPTTPARRKRREQIAAERQRQVEQLIASGVSTRPLRPVRALSTPFDGARLAGIGAEHDGTLGVRWIDPDSDRDLYTVESETERVAQVAISSFPGPVDHVGGLPGRRWLGSAARVDWTTREPCPIPPGSSTMRRTSWTAAASGMRTCDPWSPRTHESS